MNNFRNQFDFYFLCLIALLFLVVTTIKAQAIESWHFLENHLATVSDKMTLIDLKFDGENLLDDVD